MPLHKNHSEYGYIEPIKYFDPSIAISDIVGINKTTQRKYSYKQLFLWSNGQ